MLAELGLAPLELEAKEGLALTNGTSFMSGFAVLAANDARELAFVVDLCTAMATQALLGNHGHFNAFLFEAKPHPGIIQSAANVRMLLEGSALTHDAEEIVPLERRRLPRAHALGPGQVLDPLRARTSSARCATRSSGWTAGSRSRSTRPTTTRSSTSAPAASRAAATSTAATWRRAWTR